MFAHTSGSDLDAVSLYANTGVPIQVRCNYLPDLPVAGTDPQFGSRNFNHRELYEVKNGYEKTYERTDISPCGFDSIKTVEQSTHVGCGQIRRSVGSHSKGKCRQV